MPLYTWSQTSSADASADPTINWREGQAPSTINDSARAMMSATAKWRDDIAGAIVTAGTSTAYTVASNSSFDTLAHLNGQVIAFSPHATNGATVTLNVDGLGAKPLRTSPNVELLSGTIIQGTPYAAVYNNSDGAFYLQGFYGNPYNIPLGGMLPYIGSAAPNSSFALPYGQAVSRTTYATLFALCSTTFGSGDGSTTFNLPDLRGRALFGLDNMGGTAASRLTTSGGGVDGTTIGADGGNQDITIAQDQLPNVVPTIDASTAVWNTLGATGQEIEGGTGVVGVTVLFNGGAGGATQYTSKAGLASGSITSSSINGNVTQKAMQTLPPALVVPFILRII